MRYNLQLTAKQFTQFLEDQAYRFAVRAIEDRTAVDEFELGVSIYLDLSSQFGKFLRDDEDPNVDFKEAAEQGIRRASKYHSR